MAESDGGGNDRREQFRVAPPELSLPRGGGAIRGIGEKFAVDSASGTAAMSVPITTSPGRNGFGPQLSLSYNSGAGNGPFGLGWRLSLPSISRKTDKGLPRYRDHAESDVFILDGAEDLVPVLDANGQLPPAAQYTTYGKRYLVRRYRPRVEGAFALIERWIELADESNMFWRTVSRENITTWYGRSAESRVADPADPTRIYRWHICESHDDRGNAMVYRHRREDGAGIVTTETAEANRSDAGRKANCYPDRILYGNRRPFLPPLDEPGTRWFEPDHVPGQEWLFEVVFDYGDPWRVRADPFSSHRAGFEVRTYRLCRRVLMFHRFQNELQTAACLVRSTDFVYAEPSNARDAGVAGYTVLKSVSPRAYQKRSAADTTYESREYPPVVFTFSVPRISSTVQRIAPEQLRNLPTGTHGAGFQWMDLDGEGLAGVFSEQAGTWYYKDNLGDATFGPTRVVAAKPALATQPGRSPQFLDLDGDGDVELVALNGPAPGFHERDGDTGWSRFVPFASLPNLDWNDANLRFIDLTGDGLADALVTEHEAFTWHPSLGDRGFAAAERSAKGLDENAGPRLVFSDETQTIFLADLCGDGLTDLVRIRNGEVCYWPNQGYGRFGRKVTLGNSPWFDHGDQYDPRRIRLADIDGSGPTDIIYLGRRGAQIYFNRSGNSLSDALTVDLPVAAIDHLDAVQVTDLLGSGTACLVWSSHLPADSRNPVRYINLMAGALTAGTEETAAPGNAKPHLLIRVDNSLGATTDIEYAPSTQFYLRDKREGTPWITRLPFPVHCVSKVTTRDKWRGTTCSSSYSYHHGYFDGAEREFRGFGRVERLDVESFGTSAANDPASPFVTQDRRLYQPPVKTITWYHTGVAPNRKRVLSQFADEYFPRRFASRLPDPTQDPGAFHEKPLSEPELPEDLSPGEWRESLRACKGKLLREEIYELDIDLLSAPVPTHKPVRLFSASVHGYHIQRTQERGPNRNAIFLVTESEVLTYHYELGLGEEAGPLAPDPRVAHTLTLRRDEQGNPQQVIEIGYGRWRPATYAGLPRADLIAAVQGELHISYDETRYTQDVILPERVPGTARAIRHWRLRAPCELLKYDLAAIPRADAHYYFSSDFDSLDLSEEIGHRPGETALPSPVLRREFHEPMRGLAAQKRVAEHSIALYFDDGSDSGPPIDRLPLRQQGPRGFKWEDYKLALTDALLDAVFTQRDAAGNVIDAKLSHPLAAAAGTPPAATARALLDESVPGSTYLRSGYIPGSDIDASLAAQHWLRSGVAGFAADAHEHFFLPERYTDAFGDVTALQYDAYDLFVASSTDARGNTVALGELDYRVLAPREMIDANGNRSRAIYDVRGMVVATALQGKAVNGVWEGDDLSGYDFDVTNLPPLDVAAFCDAADADRTVARAWLRNATTRFVYHFGDAADQWASQPAGSCTIARERHVGQLENTLSSALQISLESSDGSGGMLMKKQQAEPEHDGGAARWLVNGLVVLNNKGKPVKQYEPSFVAEFGFQLPAAVGVTSITYYDAIGRVIRIELPDGTLSRATFTPWQTVKFDQNDTVTESGWYAQHTSPTASVADRQAAALAARHADSPALALLDGLGREAISIAHNRTPDANGAWRDERLLTFTKLDSDGRTLWVRDPRGNLVMQSIVPFKPIAAAAEPDQDNIEGLPANAVRGYDVAGNLLYQHSMDSGDRWMLTNAAGKPMLAWDFNERTLDDGSVIAERRMHYTRYDTLRRPVEQWLYINDAVPALVEAFEYLDTESFRNAAGVLDQVALDSAKSANLLLQPVRHYDPSGLNGLVRADFKGVVEELTRRLVRNVTSAVVDWNVTTRDALLEGETFRHITQRDALGRNTAVYNWHRDTVLNDPATGPRVTVQVPEYNERGLLKAQSLHVRATKSTAGGRSSFIPNAAASRNVTAIRRILWNAKGQKRRLELGNGTVTHYSYDENTFRLVRLYTRRDARFTEDRGGPPPPPRTAAPDTDAPPASCGVQNLQFTYDPVGNITHVRDDAQQTIWFANSRVEPGNDYVYDALYRLIEASGRENVTAPGPPNGYEGSWAAQQSPSADALRRYTQNYAYDSAGNCVQTRHRVVAQPGQPSGDWTRNRSIEATSNRLAKSWHGTDTANAVVHRYDSHGNLLNVARTAPAADMRWDWRDMVRALDLQGGGAAWYSYGIDKRRTRKRIVRNPTAANGGTLREDRIYLEGYELYRRYTGDPADPVEEIESHHVFEGDQRILLVDDVLKTRSPRPDQQTVRAQTLWRYQYGNHQGSVNVELDDTARVITHEEFHPFGTTSYRLRNSAADAPAKLYRYAGMERDEESGLAYHTARYYFAAAARWLSADPAGISQTLNVYAYCDGNPVNRVDTDGRQFIDAEKASTRFAGTLLTPEAGPAPPEAPPAEASASQTPAQPAPETALPEEGWFESLFSGKSEAGFWKGLIPVVGSVQNANYNFNQGSWGWGIFYTVLAITDVFLIRSILTSGFRLAAAGIRAGLSALSNVSFKAVGEGLVNGFKVALREFHPFRGTGGRLAIRTRLSRFFVQTRQSYDAAASVVYRLLRRGLPVVDAEMHHWLVQHFWYDAKVIRNSVHRFILETPWARRWAQRIGDAGWNLLPLPAEFNNSLGKSMPATFAFAVRVVRTAKANVELTWDRVKTLYGVIWPDEPAVPATSR